MNILHTITLERDRSCNMVRVRLDDTVVMEGNWWDFRNSHHPNYGSFRNPSDLITKIYQSFVRSGIDFRSIKTVAGKYTFPNP